MVHVHKTDMSTVYTTYFADSAPSRPLSMKTVMKEFRRRLLDKDSTVVYYTLLVLDSVMKNCSTEVHSEILSKEFVNVIKEVILSPKVVSGWL